MGHAPSASPEGVDRDFGSPSEKNILGFKRVRRKPEQWLIVYHEL